MSIIFIHINWCSKDESVTASIKMPLYKECIETVIDYKGYLLEAYKDSKFHFDIEIVYFDKLSYAHPSIVGYINLLSYGDVINLQQMSNFESLEVDENSVMAECYPEAMFPFDRESISLEGLNDYIQSNKDKGINDNYVRFEADEVIVYFNQQNYNLPD